MPFEPNEYLHEDAAADHRILNWLRVFSERGYSVEVYEKDLDELYGDPYEGREF